MNEHVRTEHLSTEHLSTEQVDDRVPVDDADDPIGVDQRDGVGWAEHRTATESAVGPGDAAVEDPAPADLPASEPPPSLGVLTEAVGSLRDALAASLRTQEHQQALLDKIHDEKERLREAEQRRHRDPILRDLIQLSDTCLRTSRQWRARRDVSPETAEKVGAVLVDTAADVALILERQGIEDFAPMVDDQFQRGESKAVGTSPTTDPARDGLVAEVRKRGYRLGDRVLRFSEVVVWRFESAAEPGTS
jgi:molecular chaperone GrpE (heat shock protein)